MRRFRIGLAAAMVAVIAGLGLVTAAPAQATVCYKSKCPPACRLNPSVDENGKITLYECYV